MDNENYKIIKTESTASTDYEPSTTNSSIDAANETTSMPTELNANFNATEEMLIDSMKFEAVSTIRRDINSKIINLLLRFTYQISLKYRRKIMNTQLMILLALPVRLTAETVMRIFQVTHLKGGQFVKNANQNHVTCLRPIKSVC